KVRSFCSLAAEQGYGWAWLDTCCIDKASRAELSEAINSMYAWYKAADVCYVYLFDLDDGDHPFDKDSQFRASEWHSRAWTLQELLAPTDVVFLAKSWALIGRLAVLAPVLAEICGRDRTILRGYSAWKRKQQTSVAQRMSCAARRKTKRQEDRALLVMGIFGVSIPNVYGEGLERACLWLYVAGGDEPLRRSDYLRVGPD
ncbi:hypothetical protein DICSQDRAFT_59142, partial [Dichomitus squalens LYAD-421 SS1]